MMKWYKNAVIYQIYPRSFADSNNDGVGDLRGIASRLEYLAELGVAGIWLSPINTSPMADFGYDVSDYLDIDPLFGSLADFDAMVQKAHSLDIKVLMDLVPNHTSDQHEWFKESRLSKDSPKRDWYIWKDAKPDGSPPNNWQSVFSGPAWTLDPITNQYYLHSFLKEQPDLNWANPEVQEAIKSVMRFWYDRGVDGFRVDAILFTAKDPEFKDIINPEKFGDAIISEEEADPTFKFQVADHIKSYVHILTDTTREYEDRCIFLEAYPNEAGPKGYAKLYDYLDLDVSAPFYFETLTAATGWRADTFKRAIDEFQELKPSGSFAAYVLSNHDQTRIASRIGAEAARTAAVALLTLPDTKFIYYGDELGMHDVDIAKEKLRDPSPNNRDPERTPMQWSAESYAGFSEVEPWLPLADDYKRNNVTSQQHDPRSMFNLYRHLIKISREYSELTHGTYCPIDSGDKDVFAFSRDSAQARAIILLNFSNQIKKVSLPVKSLYLLATSAMDLEEGKGHTGTIELRPHEGLVLRTIVE